ncbi:hypothetical protein OH77DRAFT_1426006 [Trametes cingulata]|nr:hypothetical protein OH77DRAFT_1426006 [Trametes cingulata]
MPHLHSLSIRLRGARTSDKSTTAATTTTPAVASNSTPPTASHSTFKHIFFGRAHTVSKSHKTAKTEKQTHPEPNGDTMGNAPSDMNSRNSSPRPRPRHLTRGSTDVESVRSASAMPGAEPPTPVPAETAEASPPEPAAAPEPWRSPSPNEERRVQGYDVQEVPHVENPVSLEEERDLEAGEIHPVGSFEDDGRVEAEKDREQTNGEERAAEDLVKTPRAAAKSEEHLAPAEEHQHEHASPPGLEQPHGAQHASDASDATAVSTGSSPGGVWMPGTYVLLNARGGTAVDMSGADNKTLIGWPMHGGPNQQWEFIPSGHGYVIRCVRRSKEGHPLYLTTEAGVGEHIAIVASTYPVSWNVEQTEDGIKISWPNTDLVFTLADSGSKNPGTKIQLMRLKSGDPSQLWHYTRCAPASEPEEGKEVEVRSARAVSPPATTETVSVTEERDYITTTRTTTTTTITTVTEVTKMPRWMLLHARPQSPNRRSIGYRLA